MIFFLKGFVSRTTLIVSALFVVGLSIGGWLYYRGGEGEARDIAIVTRGTIVQEVGVTGRVKSTRDVDLGFEKSGKINRVYAQVGTHVAAGQILAELESADLVAQLEKAKADLAAQEADLNKAKILLLNYYGEVPNISQDSYAKADDAVRNRLSALFLNGDTQNPTLTFSVSDVSIDNDVRQMRRAVGITLLAWQTALSGIQEDSSAKALEGHLILIKGYAQTIRALLVRSLDAVNNAPSTALSSTSASAYRVSIDLGRTNINTALSDIVTQEQSIASQKASIDSALASVKSYEAAITNVQAQLSKNVLRSPISGVVTVQDAKTGEIAIANATLMSVISDGQLEMEVNVPEADIAKINVGDSAKITLDAYGNDVVFEAKVTTIDPAETLVEGVATYKTALQFTRKDPRVKPGMTANIDILTEKKEGVLFLPTRALVRKDGVHFVLVDRGPTQDPEERRVEVGVRGSNGNTEILSGLAEGERVVRS